MTIAIEAKLRPAPPVAASPRVAGPTRDGAGLVAGAALAVIVFVVDVVRLRHGWATAFDLGVFDQAGWRLAHGHLDVSLLGGNLFGDHVSPVLLVLAPLYRIHATPMWLLGVQAAAIGATVPPMRRLARLEGLTDLTALTVAVLASTPLLAAGVFDFHASTLAVPAIAWMLVGARGGNGRIALAGAVAVLLCRADLVPAVVGALVVSRREARRGLVVAALAGTAVLAAPPVLGSTGLWKSFFAYLGTGPVDALSHPWRILGGLLRRQSLMAMVVWLLPAGFLPVLRPNWLLALFVAGATILLMGTPALPWYQYGAPLVPITLGAAAGAIAACPSRQWLLLAGVALGVATMSTLSPFTPAQFAARNFVHPGEAGASRLQLDMIGRDEAVAASEPVVPRLSHRSRIYAFPSPFASFGIRPGLVSTSAAADVDVVVVSVTDARQAHDVGFTRVVGGNRSYLVLRRP